MDDADAVKAACLPAPRSSNDVNMRSTRLGIFLASLVFIANLGNAQVGATNPGLTVCRVLSNPLQYDGKIIRIAGIVNATGEGAALVGEGCAGIVKTEGHVWPSQIYLELPDAPHPRRLHSVSFEFDRVGAQKIEEKYARLRKQVRAECLLLTYTGLFETRRDWSDAKAVYPNGTWKYLGFGHLSSSPAQLILKSEDDVTIVPGCRGQ